MHELTSIEALIILAICFYLAKGFANIIMGRTWKGKINKEVEEYLRKKKLL